MKTKKILVKLRHPFFSLVFSDLALHAFHAKAPYELALYSAAAIASVFLWVLELIGWGAEKPKQVEETEVPRHH